jgi:hypothetical protein
MPPVPSTPASPPAPTPVKVQLREPGSVELQKVSQLRDTLKKYNVPDAAANQIVQDQAQLKTFYAFVNNVSTAKDEYVFVTLRLFDEVAPHAEQGFGSIELDGSVIGGHARMISEITRAADHHYLIWVQFDMTTNTVQWIDVLNYTTSLPS